MDCPKCGASNPISDSLQVFSNTHLHPWEALLEPKNSSGGFFLLTYIFEVLTFSNLVSEID